MHGHRRRLADTLGLSDPASWCWLDQVHGAAVVSGADAAGVAVPPSADAAVTDRPGLPLVVLTADCLPIALVADDAVAVVHAGWPGLLAGVVEAATDRLRALGSGVVRAAIGPAAGPERYEFGPDDLDRMVGAYGPTVATTTRAGTPALDLAETARRALAGVGVTDVWTSGVCTISSPEHFSYRREGRTGRQALVAWIPG